MRGWYWTQDRNPYKGVQKRRIDPNWMRGREASNSRGPWQKTGLGSQFGIVPKWDSPKSPQKYPQSVKSHPKFPTLGLGIWVRVAHKIFRSFNFYLPLCLLQYLVLDMAGLRVSAKHMDRTGFDMCWPILSNQVEKQSLKIVHFATYHT